MKRFHPLILLVIGLLLTLCSCAGNDSGSGGGGGSGDYQFLYEHNAKELDGRTVRWGSNTVNVYTGGIPGAEAAVNRWAGPVGFNFVGSPPGDGITFNWTSSGGYCGLTNTYYFSSGRISRAVIYINTEQQNCRGGLDNTLTHETAHALGFFGHTGDGSLMDPDGGNGNITSTLRNFMSQLYAHPYGWDVNPYLSLQRKVPVSRYQPNGTTLHVRVDY